MTLYIVEEPELRGDRFEDGTTVSVAWSLEVVSEDGPIDCEGVAVDEPGQRILLVSKWTVPLRLYEVSLFPSDPETRSPAVATRVAEIPNIPQPPNADRAEDPRFGHYRSLATTLDVTKDGSELLLVTYANAYRFARVAGEGWSQAVSRPAERIALPPMAQTEAGAYSSDRQSVFVTSEQRPAPLFGSTEWSRTVALGTDEEDVNRSTPHLNRREGLRLQLHDLRSGSLRRAGSAANSAVSDDRYRAPLPAVRRVACVRWSDD